MKYYLFLTLLFLLVGLSACEINSNDDNDLPLKGSIEQGEINLFPKSTYGYVGDPMPFYDNGTMNMFYLLDERGGTIGFHPFALFQTTDFLTWNDIGTVIPYVNSISSQDLALGTGSVIKDKDGLYHAFYTGHNSSGEMPYFEKIQHATSTDLINWVKHPEHGFFGGTNDFRDPYIYYDETNDEYWMIITTRSGSTGVLKRYISKDLINWTNNGIFYQNDEGNYNMECPTLFEYNGYYYLTFSAQGHENERVLHYRYTTNIENGFVTPENDTFDGWGFYAGRVEKMNDTLVLSGWNATKTLSRDAGEYIWAGNLVNHKLYQLPNGELRVDILDQIDEKLSNEVLYSITQNNTSVINKTHEFQQQKGYNYLLFEELEEKPTKITFNVDISHSKNFGVTFNSYESVFGSLNIYFNIEENKLEFYNVDSNLITSSVPEITIDYTYGDTLDCVMITEGSVLTIYVNGEKALTSRAYNMADSEFGFFTLGSDAVLNSVNFYE